VAPSATPDSTAAAAGTTGQAAGGKPPPSSAADSKPAAAAGGKTRLPQAKNGILAPGAADKLLAPGARPIVKLTSPGSEPREMLSYALTKGSKHALNMGMDMVMSLRMGAQQVPATALPRMVMGLEMLVADKNADGNSKIDATLSRVTLEPKGAQQEAMATQMRGQMDAMKGLTMGYWLTPKGHVRDVKLGLPAGFPAQAQQMLSGMNQSFESMVTPLPDEAVGAGATWEVITRVVSSGADLIQLATYTLKSRTGTKAALDVKVTQLAAKATINPPGLPPGTTARMKSFHSDGGGTSEIDTTSVAPEGGKMVVKSGMNLEVGGAGGAPEETAVETTLTVQYTRPAN
jgi:hypothetical protein